ncbi:MAG: Gfo/Idh/MocA family oxidoreductase [Pseudaminobacter sp.]|nr:Gfo/Idh/MocA family oxidoreductase [Pseudaminobacter sp.]
MKQVFLSGRGQVELFDVPVPGRLQGGVLVRNAFSLISAGTEGAAVTKSGGTKGLYEKARSSPEKVEQVWSMVQSQGFGRTWGAVREKLLDYTPIGYSSAGVVVEVDNDDLGMVVGQRVSCMGTGFANHAEYVVVPKNLAVALPINVGFDQAAFGALACIAIQGIRRLDLSPGERVGVVGLGLIGQLALRLAAAMGYSAYGYDINEARVTHARAHGGATQVVNSAKDDPVSAVQDATAGVGLDGIVICASSKDDALVNQAFAMCRRRGRVSIVGDVGLKLERAKMYAKEIEVRLSCSYGAGRYDYDYEMKGADYPLPYVRWTERRNLEFFIGLLASGRLDVSDLVSARIDIEKCEEAYARVKSGDSTLFGVLFDYHLPETPTLTAEERTISYASLASTLPRDIVRIGLIGVGGYAKNVHIPNIAKIDTMRIAAVASKSGGSAAIVARKVKADYATSDTNRLFADPLIDAVIISTRHASHAGLIAAALQHNKHVFVEKPMATTIAECLAVLQAQRKSGKLVRVGYNRRFAPMLQKMKAAVGGGRKIFNIRVNVGAMGGHWSNTVDEGGRLMGEGVHFFDIANWMMDGSPVALTSQFLGAPDKLNPDASVSIRYADGSVANVVYLTTGSASAGKEYFELHGGGRTAIVDDYHTAKSFGCALKVSRADRGNKGQLEAMREFSAVVRGGDGGDGADVAAGLWATAIAELSVEAARTGREILLRDAVDVEADAVREERTKQSVGL